jgi:hypothetical protein
MHVRRNRFFLRFVIFVTLVSQSNSIASAQNSNSASVPPQDVAAQPPAPVHETPKAAITILEDTLIRVRTLEPLNSKKVKEGSPVLFMVSEGVFVGDTLAIPPGATVHGVVINSKKSGVLTGSPELELQLVSLDLGGRTYPLDSYHFKVKGASKTQPTETKAIRGAYVGAIVGGVGTKPGTGAAGLAANMGTVAAVGAGLGTLASAATPGPGIWFPSESQVDFFLAAPVTVTPVSAKEAARLSRGLHPGGPTLYLRGDAP